MAVSLMDVILSIYSIIDNEGFNAINRGDELGVGIACLVLIFLIYNKWTIG